MRSIPPRKQFATAVLLLVSGTGLFAQNPPRAPQPAQAPSSALPAKPVPAPRTLILLDPAHGGPDSGARLSNNQLEKTVTLAFNNRLRALLSAANFAVISTRTSDPSTAFTTDQRAEIANHDHPALCLVLHATGSGSGVHLFTSTLAPSRQSHYLRWDKAQAPSVAVSRDLARRIGAALLQAKLPILLNQASIPPVDNLTCPAIAIELAPLPQPGVAPVSNPDYQQRVAQAIVTALTQWRDGNATTELVQ